VTACVRVTAARTLLVNLARTKLGGDRACGVAELRRGISLYSTWLVTSRLDTFDVSSESRRACMSSVSTSSTQPKCMGSLSRRVVSRRDEPSGIWAIQKNLLTHDFKQRDLDDRPTADSDSRQRSLGSQHSMNLCLTAMSINSLTYLLFHILSKHCKRLRV